jgi:glutathione peroxidase
MTSSIFDLPLKTIDGQPASLKAFEGKVLLIVNVASKCGLTPQYEGLEALYEKYRDQGLVVLGFPANDFAGQEPGSDSDIQQFCTLNYAVKFPMFSKIVVTGEEKHALYASLVEAQPATEGREGVETMLKGHGITPTSAPEVVWNFEKFLIGRDGKVLRRFAPATKPDDAALVSAVESALV